MTVHIEDRYIPRVLPDVALPESPFELINLQFGRKCTGTRMTCRLCARIWYEGQFNEYRYPSKDISCMTENVVYKILGKAQGQIGYYEYYGITHRPLRHEMRKLRKKIDSPSSRESKSKFIQFYQLNNVSKVRVSIEYHTEDTEALKLFYNRVIGLCADSDEEDEEGEFEYPEEYDRLLNDVPKPKPRPYLLGQFPANKSVRQSQMDLSNRLSRPKSYHCLREQDVLLTDTPFQPARAKTATKSSSTSMQFQLTPHKLP